MLDQTPIRRAHRAAEISKWVAIVGTIALSVLVAMLVPPPKNCEPMTIAGSILLAGCPR